VNTARARHTALGVILAAAHVLAPAARAQAGNTSSAPITMGAGGYRLNLVIRWTCDDDPSRTVSDPGRIDLLDAGGALVGQVVATAGRSGPSVTVSGPGTISGATASIHIYGASGTPADGLVHATWTITGPGPGAYTLRYWFYQVMVPGNPLSAVSTDSLDAGGSGAIGGAPTPIPTPTPSPTPTAHPPTVAVSAPPSATAFQAVGVGATATEPAGGNPLASVVLEVSGDNGRSWGVIASNGHPSSPSDSEEATYAFPAAGTAMIRAIATDTAGLTATSTQAVAVARAGQGTVAITPAAATLAAGQSVLFSASGGSTGNYAWGGSASGTGPAQAVTFPAPGSYTVTAADTGDANYNPSQPASAIVSVQTPFYTLSVSASGGGTVSGGGSYPPNSQATAAAAAGDGNAFAGWTGDVTAMTPSISVLMSANRSVTAHFTPLLAQSISFVAPGPVSTRTPAFALSVTSSSGLPVSLALDSGPVSLAGNVVTPSGIPGEVALTATQPGNAQYLPARPVVIAFPIGPPPPGVILRDDSAATKKSDKATRATSFTSDGGH